MLEIFNAADGIFIVDHRDRGSGRNDLDLVYPLGGEVQETTLVTWNRKIIHVHSNRRKGLIARVP